MTTRTKIEGLHDAGRPTVLFLCVHNAGRSHACPVFPGKRYEEWVLDDPAGPGLDAVRPIRDDVERRVRRLLEDLDVPAQGHPRSGR